MRPIDKTGYTQGNPPAGPSEVGSAGDAGATKVPMVTAGNVRAFVAALKAHGSWMKQHLLGIEERKVRRLASVARPVVVSYPGSPGYCHIDFVSDEQLEHCINAHRAVAKDHTCTANLYQDALNRRRMKRAPAAVQQLFAM